MIGLLSTTDILSNMPPGFIVWFVIVVIVAFGAVVWGNLSGDD